MNSEVVIYHSSDCTALENFSTKINKNNAKCVRTVARWKYQLYGTAVVILVVVAGGNTNCTDSCEDVCCGCFNCFIIFFFAREVILRGVLWKVCEVEVSVCRASVVLVVIVMSMEMFDHAESLLNGIENELQQRIDVLLEVNENYRGTLVLCL